MFTRKKGAGSRSKKLTVLWDGTAAFAAAADGSISRIARAGSLDDKRLEGSAVRVVLAPPAILWNMIPTPESHTEAFWSILAGREDSRFDEDDTVCRHYTAPGISDKNPAIAEAVGRRTLGALATCASAAKWKVECAVGYIDALAAGCSAAEPSQDGRRAWLVAGASSSILLVGDGPKCVYAMQFQWGSAQTGSEKGMEEIIQTLASTITTLTRRISADTHIDRLVVFCSSTASKRWLGCSEGFGDSLGIPIAISPMDEPSEVILQSIALSGAAEMAKPSEQDDYWESRPADVPRIARRMAAAAATAIVLAACSGTALFSARAYEKKAAEYEKSAAESASSIVPRSDKIAAMEKEAAVLNASIAGSKTRMAAAEAVSKAGDGQGSTAAAEAMDAFSRFSAPGAGLDALSARWEGDGEPALSAVGWAESRDAAVAAALSLSRIGYGRWGASDIGWGGKTWTFRLDAPAARQPSQGDGTQSGLPGQTPPSKFGPAKPAGDYLTSGRMQGPGVPDRKRPSPAGTAEKQK